MPKMDGMEATQEIRKLGPQYEKLPIVALTANAVSGMREMFLSHGFNGFISKPIVMQELDTILKEWLSPEKVSAVAKTADAGSDAGFIEAVRKITDINVEIGLNRFSGMHDMYRSTLELFYQKINAECDKMSAFLEANDGDNFMIAVHAIKSSLATIGAMRLSDAAYELETAAKRNDRNFCIQRFPAFKEQFLALRAQLAVLFPATPAPRDKKPGDAEHLHEHVQKALTAAADFDNDTALGIIMNLLLFDFGEKSNVLLEDARAALENFEHEGAVKILEAL